MISIMGSNINNSAVRMAVWLLISGRDKITVMRMIMGEMPWLAPLDVLAAVEIAREKIDGNL